VHVGPQDVVDELDLLVGIKHLRRLDKPLLIHSEHVGDGAISFQVDWRHGQEWHSNELVFFKKCLKLRLLRELHHDEKDRLFGDGLVLAPRPDKRVSNLVVLRAHNLAVLTIDGWLDVPEGDDVVWPWISLHKSSVVLMGEKDDSTT